MFFMALGSRLRASTVSWRLRSSLTRPPLRQGVMPKPLGLPLWSLALPAFGLIAILISLARLGTIGTIAATAILIGCILAAVHHAEVVAHRVGEPFGTLVLAVAVTVIEVSLIVSLMLSDSGDASTSRAIPCSRRS